MKAITISHYGAPEVLTVTELPDPAPAAEEILVEVKAFGLNHAETYMRSGQWGDVAQVTGIEAAGVVAADPSGRLAPGTPVVAIMGGMGRTRNGSYAELVTVPAGNVVPVHTALEWTDLAAIPEVYATAWTTLHDNLAVTDGETVLVRGATSSLGQAAVNIAADFGATVIATTRSQSNAAMLEKIGAAQVLIEDGNLLERVHAAGLVVDALLDLVGNSVLRDSVATVRPRGRVCQAGFLGGLAPVPEFDPIADLPSGVQLSFFGSFVFGTPGFPLSAVPLADLVAKAEAGAYHAKPVRTFTFDEIVRAHEVMESGTAGGKMTVAVG
ncbi:zinc-binding dehydrogenase [Nocardia aurantiaca]|uniref:Zinc-binding dehydrogenase n=1 Tax=Nocardia aurantiaca TaxID=2675850 RepID=A0A6I3L8Q2_9NOCA|nr:zinc-binding dehydrogenase [Nocardia aurantiaca]MTE16239.1 zinc-binding dehydrogenase [Nocardia aurantiaca]